VPARLEIALLGPVTVRVDGVAVPLPSAPQRVVLAGLALAADRTASPAALCDALWPAYPPRNATGNLHTYVSRLRQVVGADRIGREPGGYRLRGDVEVDVERAEELVAKARSGPPAEAVPAYASALALWRGEPLSDLPDPAAFAPDLARLAAWRRQVELEWFTARLAAGQAGAALPDLERATAADPLREDVHVLLATALHHVGRSADALQVVAAYRRRLADEHGLDPSAALTELAGRLLADDPALRPPPVAPVGAGAGSGSSGAGPGSTAGPGSPAHGPGAVSAGSGPAAGDSPAVAPRRTYAPGDRFVGRRDELAAVAAALDGHRLVTVVGPGGVGKTRLSLELVDGLDVGRPATVVELHQISRPDDVPVTVATAFGLEARTTAARRPVDAVGELIGGASAVLVLDNCEHVRTAARDLAVALLARCSGLRILATSRQRLGLPGEKVVRLGPLPAADQVELFCDRAALLRADFAATDQVRAVAGQICAAIDGLPLAVELAASREAVFGVTQLRDRLSAGLEVLEPARDADRASAVTATVEWSYRLLDQSARDLFDRLSVCHGFPLDAVGFFAPGAAGPALLAELVEASLVVTQPTVDGPRYRLLETMRLVGDGHLDAGGRAAAQEMRLAWMISHIERFHALQNARSPEAARVLAAELVNLRDVIAWTIDSGRWADAGRLAVPVAFGLIDYPDLGLLTQLSRLVDVPDDAPPATRGRCLLAAGGAYWLQGDAPVAERLLSQAGPLLPPDEPRRWVARYFLLVNHMFAGTPDAVHADADALGADRSTPAGALATAMCCSALTYAFTGDPSAAEARLAEHADVIARIADRDGFVAYTRGELAAGTDPGRALDEFETACRLADAQGHRYIREVSWIGRTAVLIRLGRGGEAARSCRTGLDSLRSSGMWPQLWVMLRLAAELLVDLGGADVPARLLAAGENDPLAPAVHPPERRRHAALWVTIGERLGADGVAAARADAIRLDRPAAVELALHALEQHV
jgi:predicted ATPase/DNA-binding SARP family transcriptional activator